MDRQLSDAAEHEQRCRQFAVPIGPLYNDVNLDEISLPSMQSSLWSYSPSYQQVRRSAWLPADSGCSVVSRDTSNQPACQYRPISDGPQFRDLSCCWLEPDRTTAFVGDAADSFRTVDNFGSVCDTVQSNVQSGEWNSSPIKRTRSRPSPANSGEFLASSDVELRQKLNNAQHCLCNYQRAKTTSTLPQTTNCHHVGIHSCDKLDDIAADEPRTGKSEFMAAGNTTPCSYSEELFPVTCKLHSVHSASSAEESTEDCFDVHRADTSRLHHHHHFHPTRQQSLFTNCHKTDFRSYNITNSQQGQRNLCARQSASMNDLDVIDLPLHSSSSVPTEVVENTVSAATGSDVRHGTDCVASTKPDAAFSHLRKRELGIDIVGDDPESGYGAAATIKENSRSDLNVQSCVEQDASTLLPSVCPKLPSSSRKSKKKVQRAPDEKLRPVVTKRTVCDDNLAAYNGAIDNNMCTAASEHADRTAHVNVKSTTDCRVAEDRTDKSSPHEEANKPESHSLTTCAAPECSDQFSADPVETDKLSHSSASRYHAESRSRPETQTGLRHHRRSVRKASSCPGPKQKSTRRNQQQDQTASFPLKQFLLSIDWQRQQQNLGMFLLFVSTEL